MANVELGTFQGDEYYVPLKTVAGNSMTQQEMSPFATIQDRKDKMISRYSKSTPKK